MSWYPQFKPKKQSSRGVLPKSSQNFLKKFSKFAGKHVSQSLFFNNVAGLRPATLLKKRLWHRWFSVNFAKFLRTTFFIEYLRWLLLEPSTGKLNKWVKDKFMTFRDRRQVFLLMLREFKRINEVIFPLKSSRNLFFFYWFVIAWFLVQLTIKLTSGN